MAFFCYSASMRYLGFYIFFCGVLGQALLATPKTIFEARYKGAPAYTIEVEAQNVVHHGRPLTLLETRSQGPNIEELNQCLLDETLQLVHLFQTSQNGYTKAHYQWEIDFSDAKGQVTYGSLGNPKRHLVLVTHPNTRTLQTFLFSLKDQDLEPGTSLQFWMLTPPASLFSMTATVVGTDTFDGAGLRPFYSDWASRRDCYRIECQVSGLFGYLLPKTTLWVTQKKPHIPVKYVDQQQTIVLVKTVAD
ncbi:MAG: hypothetical protein AB7F28_01330 [Candidatus Margulisiibacteriota bacterium]